MASYHFDKNKGGMVKCHTAEPNGVCRIHGNSDVQANSAEEAQHKYNEMKRDEAKAEDMSEMPSEYAIEVWKVHCDSINDGNDDGMGPKTIAAIANKPGVWESLDKNAARMLAESANPVINDDVKNTVMLRFGNYFGQDGDSGFMEFAPEWVLRMNGYKPATDVLGDVSDYFESDEFSENEVQDSVQSAWDKWDDDVKVANGVIRGRVLMDEYDNQWVDEKVADEMKRQYFDEYEKQSYDAGYLGDNENYMDSEQYQQEKSNYYNAMGLSL